MSIRDGLIAWYKLNGNLNDSSGHGYHGIANKSGNCNDIEFIECEFGTCAKFDGRADNIGCYFETPFRLQEDMSTLSLWVKTPSLVSYHNHICTSGGNNDYLIKLDNLNKPNVLLLDKGIGSGTALGLDTWYHLVYAIERIDPARCRITIYVDGSIVLNTVGNYPVNTTLHSKNLSFGVDWDGNSPTGFFNGLMRDIRIFNRALSKDEIDIIRGGFNYSDKYVASIDVKSDEHKEFDFNMIVNDMGYTNDSLLYSYGRYHNLCPAFNIDTMTKSSNDLALYEIEDEDLISNRALHFGGSQGVTTAVAGAFIVENLEANKVHTLSFKSKFIFNQRGYKIEVLEGNNILQSISVEKEANNHKRYYEDKSLSFTPKGTRVKIRIEISSDTGGSVFRIAFGDFQINIGDEIQEYSTPCINGAVLVQENTVNELLNYNWGVVGGIKDPTDFPSPPPVRNVFLSSKVNKADWPDLFNIGCTIVLAPNESLMISAWVYCQKQNGKFNLQCNYTIDGSDPVNNHTIGSKDVVEGWNYLVWKKTNTATVNMTFSHIRLEAYNMVVWPDGDNTAWGCNYTIEKKQYQTICDGQVNRKRQELVYPFPYYLNTSNFSICGWIRPTINSSIEHTDTYYHSIAHLVNVSDATKNIMISYYGNGNNFRAELGSNSSSLGNIVLTNKFSFTPDDNIFFCLSIVGNKMRFHVGKKGDTNLHTAEREIADIDFSGLRYLNLGMAYNKTRQGNMYSSHIHLVNREINTNEAQYLFNSLHKPCVENDTVLYLDFDGNADSIKLRKLLYSGYAEVGFSRCEGVVIPSKGAINYDFEVINKSVGTIEKRRLQFEKGSDSTSYTRGRRDTPSLIYPISILNQNCGTISFWFMLLDEKTSGANPIFTNGGTEANHAFDLLCIRDETYKNGRLYYRKYYGKDLSGQMAFNSPVDLYKKWNHIAVTYEHKGNSRIYLNGQLMATSASFDMTTMGDFFAIGSNFRAPMSFKMDELRIDGIVRTQDEILAWYNTEYPFYPRGEEYIIL